MNIKEKVELYSKLHQEILEYFDYKGGDLFEVSGARWWHFDGRNLYFGYAEGGAEWNEEVRSGKFYGGDVPRGYHVRRDDYVLLNYDNSCGEQYLVVMPVSAEITDPDKIYMVLDHA